MSRLGPAAAIALGKVMHGQANLPHIAAASHPPRCGSGTLNGGQQHGYQNSDNGDHDQQFDECKSPAKNEVHLSDNCAAIFFIATHLHNHIRNKDPVNELADFFHDYTKAYLPSFSTSSELAIP